MRASTAALPGLRWPSSSRPSFLLPCLSLDRSRNAVQRSIYPRKGRWATCRRALADGDQRNRSEAEQHRIGLVLSGGGARGAYEAGVMSVLAPGARARAASGPTIYIGTSVGAINAAYLAASEHLPADEAGEGGLERWREVQQGHGRPADPAAPGAADRAALRGRDPLAARACGCRACSTRSRFERNLDRWIDWDAVHRNVDDGRRRDRRRPSRPPRAPAAPSCSSRATRERDHAPLARDRLRRRRGSTTSTCARRRRSRSCSRRCGSSTRARRAAGTSTAARG